MTGEVSAKKRLGTKGEVSVESFLVVLAKTAVIASEARQSMSLGFKPPPVP
ncbi:MAG: hypothetical protein ACOVKR_09565 [Limnohabitans sp.]|jgi:hypothetical protein